METSTANTKRIQSIDILRGIVMIIMALDHTREFFHNTAMTKDPLDPATTTAAVFFTRWITHFCAPVFLFLSGLSAYLSSQNKQGSKAALFQLKRGLWLIVAEVTIVTLGLTFNPFYNFIILQVIWAIGWSMIILGVLMQISNKAILVTGILFVFGHNMLDYMNLSQQGAEGILLKVLLTSPGVFPVNSNHLIGAFYAILPWTGLMLLGYSLGPYFKNGSPAERRKRLLIILGLLLITLFIILRVSGVYGDPGRWKYGENLFSFLNTSKYPPSLQFCCMTIGPALLLLAFFEHIQYKWTKIVSVYGRVPFFYYLIHFYLLHTLLVIAFFASGHTAAEIADPKSIFGFRPVKFGYPLWFVYVIWITVVVTLYFPCRWYNNYKLQHRQWWLKYI